LRNGTFQTSWQKFCKVDFKLLAEQIGQVFANIFWYISVSIGKKTYLAICLKITCSRAGLGGLLYSTNICFILFLRKAKIYAILRER
jgi:hypothetical protein